jgi:hypothetical protein
MATLAATAASGRSVSGDAKARLPHLDHRGSPRSGCREWSHSSKEVASLGKRTGPHHGFHLRAG